MNNLKIKTAVQLSLPLILKPLLGHSTDINTIPIKVVRTGYQAFDRSLLESSSVYCERRV